MDLVRDGDELLFTSEASSARLSGVSEPFSFIEAMLQVYNECNSKLKCIRVIEVVCMCVCTWEMVMKLMAMRFQLLDKKMGSCIGAIVTSTYAQGNDLSWLQ